MNTNCKAWPIDPLTSQTWQGKAQGDPFVVRGGYNCRHHWQPTDPDWDL